MSDKIKNAFLVIQDMAREMSDKNTYLSQRNKEYKRLLDLIGKSLADLQNKSGWESLIRELDNPLGQFYDEICEYVTEFEDLESSSSDLKVYGNSPNEEPWLRGKEPES